MKPVVIQKPEVINKIMIMVGGEEENIKNVEQ